MRVIMGAYLCAVPEADFSKQFHLAFFFFPMLDSRRLVQNSCGRLIENFLFQKSIRENE